MEVKRVGVVLGLDGFKWFGVDFRFVCVWIWIFISYDLFPTAGSGEKRLLIFYQT